MLGANFRPTQAKTGGLQPGIQGIDGTAREGWFGSAPGDVITHAIPYQDLTALEGPPKGGFVAVVASL
jgi:hypothetical protein